MKALIRVTNSDFEQKKESAVPGAPTVSGSSSMSASWRAVAGAAVLGLLVTAAAGL